MENTKKIIWTRHYNNGGQCVEAHFTGDKGDYSIRKIIKTGGLGNGGKYVRYEVSNSPKRTSWYLMGSFLCAKSWAGQFRKKN